MMHTYEKIILIFFNDYYFPFTFKGQLSGFDLYLLFLFNNIHLIALLTSILTEGHGQREVHWNSNSHVF